MSSYNDDFGKPHFGLVLLRQFLFPTQHCLVHSPIPGVIHSKMIVSFLNPTTLANTMSPATESRLKLRKIYGTRFGSCASSTIFRTTGFLPSAHKSIDAEQNTAET
jgi:hypothetical protein